VAIIVGNACQVLCNATADLISRRQRPYLFAVRVKGLPPHTYERTYHIAAKRDDLAANAGIKLFVKEFSYVEKLITHLESA
jgi:hypothetical protein